MKICWANTGSLRVIYPPKGNMYTYGTWQQDPGEGRGSTGHTVFLKIAAR